MSWIATNISGMTVEDAVDELRLLAYELGGDEDMEINRVRARYGLCFQEAQLFNLLNKNAGRWVSNDVLVEHLNSTTKDGRRLASILVSKIKRKMLERGFDLQIESMSGYRRIKNYIDVNDGNGVLVEYLDDKFKLWSNEEDIELLRMAENGSQLSAISDELERSERAITERLKFHGFNIHQSGNRCVTIWNAIEDAFLVSMMRRNVGYTVAARAIGRSERAIRERWRSIRCDYGFQGK